MSYEFISRSALADKHYVLSLSERIQKLNQELFQARLAMQPPSEEDKKRREAIKDGTAQERQKQYEKYQQWRAKNIPEEAKRRVAEIEAEIEKIKQERFSFVRIEISDG